MGLIINPTIQNMLQKNQCTSKDCVYVNCLPESAMFIILNADEHHDPGLHKLMHYL